MIAEEFLRLAEVGRPEHPVKPLACIIALIESDEERRKIEEILADHPDVLDHGWMSRGYVINFATRQSAALFRYAYDGENEVVRTT